MISVRVTLQMSSSISLGKEDPEEVEVQVEIKVIKSTDDNLEKDMMKETETETPIRALDLTNRTEEVLETVFVTVPEEEIKEVREKDHANGPEIGLKTGAERDRSTSETDGT